MTPELRSLLDSFEAAKAARPEALKHVPVAYPIFDSKDGTLVVLFTEYGGTHSASIAPENIAAVLAVVLS